MAAGPALETLQLAEQALCRLGLPPLPLPVGWLLAQLDCSKTSPRPDARIRTGSDVRLYSSKADLAEGALITTEMGVPLAGRTERRPLAAENEFVSSLFGCAQGLTLSHRQVAVRPTSPNTPVSILADAEQDDVLALVAPHQRSAAAAAIKRAGYDATRMIQSGVVDALLKERLRLEPASYATHGFARALAEAGVAQGKKERGRCFNRTTHRVYAQPDGSSVSQISGSRCGSWRCKRCRKWLAETVWQPRVRRQIQDDFYRDEAHYVMITLTADPRDWINAAEAAMGLTSSTHGPWRQFYEGLRTAYPDLAYLKVVEWTDEGRGWPHIALLIRSKLLIDAMVSDAGVADHAALIEQVRPIDVENKARKEIGEKELPMPHSRVHKQIGDMAKSAGYGAICYVAPVCDLQAMAGEIVKVSQCNDAMPVDLRRVHPSGKEGDGKATTLFRHRLDDEPKSGIYLWRIQSIEDVAVGAKFALNLEIDPRTCPDSRGVHRATFWRGTSQPFLRLVKSANGWTTRQARALTRYDPHSDLAGKQILAAYIRGGGASKKNEDGTPSAERWPLFVVLDGDARGDVRKQVDELIKAHSLDRCNLPQVVRDLADGLITRAMLLPERAATRAQAGTPGANLVGVEAVPTASHTPLRPPLDLHPALRADGKAKRHPEARLMSCTIYSCPPSTFARLMAETGDPSSGWHAVSSAITTTDWGDPIDRVTFAVAAPHDRSGLLARLYDAQATLSALGVLGVDVRKHRKLLADLWAATGLAPPNTTRWSGSPPGPSQAHPAAGWMPATSVAA